MVIIAEGGYCRIAGINKLAEFRHVVGLIEEGECVNWDISRKAELLGPASLLSRLQKNSPGSLDVSLTL